MSETAEDDGLSLARRIVLYLSHLPPLTKHSMATLAYTQQGMAHSLGRTQSSFARALLRLEEAGLVTGVARLVPGQPRKLKVYSLTAVGQTFARFIQDEGREEPRVFHKRRPSGSSAAHGERGAPPA